MGVRFISTFLNSPYEVSNEEAGVEVDRGGLSLEAFYLTAAEATIFIGIIGDRKGLVLYAMSRAMASSAGCLPPRLLLEKGALIYKMKAKGVGISLKCQHRRLLTWVVLQTNGR